MADTKDVPKMRIREEDAVKWSLCKLATILFFIQKKRNQKSDVGPVFF